MAKLVKREHNPLEQPKVASKWYHVDEFRVTVEKCRACGKPVVIGKEDLESKRFIVCSCGRGCFEVEVRLVHTIES